ncbi:unnamed protein product, partial [Meganyctiphanes norvegica]
SAYHGGSSHRPVRLLLLFSVIGVALNTEATTSTTTKPAHTTNPYGYLKCYDCLGCPSVGENTTTVVEGPYQSCLTIVDNAHTVFRAGSYEEHPDGECVENTESISCWYSEDLCNDQQVDL